jgi:hypothetical protein
VIAATSIDNDRVAARDHVYFAINHERLETSAMREPNFERSNF